MFFPVTLKKVYLGIKPDLAATSALCQAWKVIFSFHPLYLLYLFSHFATSCNWCFIQYEF